MFLEHLTIHGFKSFANKTTLDFRGAKQNGSFGITAIVGPNGSGKSNVVDAIRWVLGEQSAKQLRGKKSGDVIFAGTDKKTRASSAQVSLKLDNTNDRIGVGFSEIELTRQLFRSGDSDYLINDKKSRLQDIAYLLAKAHIGQKSYTVIGQGTIDAVLNATPLERKDFFDEAAGIKQYQIKKDQAANKLAQAEENLQQGQLQLNEISPRLRSLTRQMKRLEQREEVLQMLHAYLTAFYKQQWEDLTTKSKRVLDDKLAHEKERDALATQLQTLQEQMEQLAHQETESNTTQELQNKYETLLNEKQQLQGKRAEWQHKRESKWAAQGAHTLNFVQQKIDSTTQELQTAKTNLTTIYNSIEAQADRHNELQQAYKVISKKISELQEKIFSQVAPQDAQKSDIISTIKENIQGLLAEVDNTIATAIAQQTPLAEMQTSLDTALDNIRHQLDQLPIPEEAANIDKWRAALKAAEVEKKELDAKLNDINATRNTLQGKVETLSSFIKDKENELASLTTEKQTLEQNTSETDQDASIDKNIQTLDEQIATIENTIADIKKKLTEASTADQNQKQELYTLQKDAAQKQQELNAIAQSVNQCEVELARLQTRLEDTKRNAEHDFDKPFAAIEPILQKAEAAHEQLADLEKKIDELKRKKEQIGSIDDETVTEYNEIKERHEWLERQTTDLSEAIASLKKIIADLDEKIDKQFSENMKKINEKFSHYFHILFNGGNSALRMVKSEIEKDDEDEITEEVVSGIEIVATPPGKRLQNITMLSGGEKALTSIALICAIIANNKSPFVVLDEVDAALDEANSARFASILSELSAETQFIVVTHNRATMEQAQLLYGVTMGDDGVSKLLSIKLEEGKAFANR